MILLDRGDDAPPIFIEITARSGLAGIRCRLWPRRVERSWIVVYTGMYTTIHDLCRTRQEMDNSKKRPEAADARCGRAGG
jgi:hypothetical protein